MRGGFLWPVGRDGRWGVGSERDQSPSQHMVVVGSFGQRDCRLRICVSPLVQGLLTAEGHKMGPQNEGMAVKGAEDLR